MGITGTADPRADGGVVLRDRVEIDLDVGRPDLVAVDDGFVHQSSVRRSWANTHLRNRNGVSPSVGVNRTDNVRVGFSDTSNRFGCRFNAPAIRAGVERGRTDGARARRAP
jgi:hypothetical protein